MKRIVIQIYLYMLAIFLIINFCLGPLFTMVIRDFYQHESESYWSDIVRGFYHTIEADLSRRPMADWENTVVELQGHFAFPITITTLAAMDTTESEALSLNKGDVVVQGDGEVFLHQIGHSGQILTMGPIPTREDQPEFKAKLQKIQLMFYLIIAVLFFGFALLWALPLARNLNRLSTAATAFGRGELDARTTISKRSSLSPLAEAFNHMANRIQKLIASHRELTHMVSHELRTPLARIRFNMEMMANAKKSAEREKRQDEIRRDIDELDMLVTELLTYARFDHENFHPPKEQLDLAPWLQELTTIWNEENDHLRIDFRINSPDTKMPALVNPRFLERAVRNLLQNAERYTRQRIHLTLETTEKRHLIHVDDDGPGIAAADRKRIFEPFVRLNQDEEREASGYGLGLAIVQRIADWHGAEVIVEEAPIGGARFTLRWPISAGATIE
ncbi:MAG: HAMP domain-containing protein [Proteobacteria bacterium]|nr:HAMP domain-containing protein [Pseudomonadota bacterium]MBU1687242.1 HAMP domain-containing protein [Pseudomonadota bacterium]